MSPAHRIVPIDGPYDLLESWRLVPLGRHDPSVQRLPDGIGWATHTAEGPATVHLAQHTDGVHVHAWGPGAETVLSTAPAFTGLSDAPPSIDLPAPLARMAREQAHCRLVQLPTIFEPLVRIILQQKVTFAEACRGWGLLVDRFGTPAPGPLDLVVPPSPSTVARIPSHEFTRMGVQRKMADTIRLVASRARAIERAATSRPPEELADLLHRLRGIGPWTTGMLLGLYRAHGDAVILADFHLPNTVAYALAGEPRADDDRMLALLEPYRPHRMHVVRWIHAAGIKAPRRGHRVEAQPLPGARR